MFCAETLYNAKGSAQVALALTPLKVGLGWCLTVAAAAVAIQGYQKSFSQQTRQLQGLVITSVCQTFGVEWYGNNHCGPSLLMIVDEITHQMGESPADMELAVELQVADQAAGGRGVVQGGQAVVEVGWAVPAAAAERLSRGLSRQRQGAAVTEVEVIGQFQQTVPAETRLIYLGGAAQQAAVRVEIRKYRVHPVVNHENPFQLTDRLQALLLSLSDIIAIEPRNTP